ncbi:MAG: HD-GYP domain-containing protein [Gammaproteobacteria bacterium]
MSTPALSTSVNKHYLNKVMKLTDVMDVAASEDIYDMRGMKLVAKGARLTRAQQDTLGLHKLKKSLESTLIAEGAADANLIVTTAARLLASSPPLGRILATVKGQGASPLAILSNMQFGHAMRMMLTLTDRLGPHALEHSVTVSLLSILMAKKLRLPDDGQMAAGLAGLLHDIGELYIDPIYLEPGKRLLPHEWAHLVVHPRIGQMLIDDLESYPPYVGRAVAEHHERYDGTGYPRQLTGRSVSPAGHAVSVAEMIAGVLHKDFPLERAELALKIVPGEHARDLLSAVSGALRSQDKHDQQHASHTSADDDVERLFNRIAAIIGLARELAARPSMAPAQRELIERTVVRVRTIERAFISTGLDAYLNDDHGLHDADHTIHFEKAVATREIQWRLRDIARDLALHAAGSTQDLATLAGLIELLDDSPASEERGADAALTPQAPRSFGGQAMAA